MIDPVARQRYSRALYDAAKAAGEVDSVLTDLEALAAEKAAEELIRTLENPQHKADLKRQVIEAVGQKCSSKVTAQFLKLLLRKSRIGILPGVAVRYRELVKEAQGVVHCEVILASKPGPNFSKAIEKALKRITHTEVEMAVKVDTKVLGGIALKIKHKILDATFSKRLHDLKYELLGTNRNA